MYTTLLGITILIVLAASSVALVLELTHFTGDIVIAKHEEARIITEQYRLEGMSLEQAAPEIVNSLSGIGLRVAVFDATGRFLGGDKTLRPKLLDRVVQMQEGRVVLPPPGGPPMGAPLEGARRPEPLELTEVDGGFVAFQPSIALLLAALLPYWRVVITIAVAAILLSWFLGRFVARQALHPISEITDSLRALADGDFTQRRFMSPGGDEIGELTKAYNDAAASVSSAMDERRQTEERMRQFVADAGHELRTPLTVIGGYIDVLRRGAVAEPSIARQILGTMSLEKEHMRGLIDRLMRLARLDSETPPHKEEIDLASLLRDQCEAARRLDEVRQIDYSVDGATTIEADRAELGEALWNVVENALKYAPEAPIHLRASRNNGTTTISVRDEGPGMTESERLHAFERFYRGDQRGEISGQRPAASPSPSVRWNVPAGPSNCKARRAAALPSLSRSNRIYKVPSVVYQPSRQESSAMIRRLLAACTALALLLVFAPLHAFAQSDSGSIRIIVSDESGKTPLGLARVVLDGPVVTSELSDKKGQVYFVDVPDGIYRARIAHRDYQTITSQPFEVVNGRAVTVTVTLALATNLKVIGTVSARSSASISTTSINSDSAQRKLSNDLADALNKLSGVSVSTSGDDSDATQTISLEGHDPTQTQLTLDGIPLNAPGQAGNLSAFATDLFGGATVRQGPQAGGLGGSVGFSTLQPTLSWRSQLQLGVGSNGKYNYSFGESGSFGKFGTALQGTYRQNTSLVDGLTYLDASGLDYSHNGDSAIAGSLARFRYQFSDSQTLTGTFLGSSRTTNLVCLRVTQAVPCGYGPDNSADGNVQMYSLQDNALVGETSVVASIYSTTFFNVNDQLNRYVDGVAQPIGFSTENQNHGYTLSATLPERERHTISLQAYGSWSDSTTSPLVSQANPYYNSTSYSNYSTVSITDTIHSNDKLTLSESLGGNRATGGLSSVLGTIGATWRPTSRDTWSGYVSLGGIAPSQSRSDILTDPASAAF